MADIVIKVMVFQNMNVDGVPWEYCSKIKFKWTPTFIEWEEEEESAKQIEKIQSERLEEKQGRLGEEGDQVGQMLLRG